MTPYQSFLQAVFGPRYALHTPLLQTIHLYCLFVVTLTLSLCLYTLFGYHDTFDRTFRQRVHQLRVKYAAAERPGDD